ncbi:Nitrate regulatory gene2 protein, partial [Mucuna pruriens]
MGCNNSRLDRLPAVALCRDRCKFVDEALCQSYALADAHVAHMESLKTLGPALLCFFDGFEDFDETNVPIKETKVPVVKSPTPRSPSSVSSDSDAHFLLHSESEPEDAEKEEFQVFAHTRYDYAPSARYPPFSPPRSGGYSGSKPPSPPPPPSGSAWDFLNFFEPYEKYHVPYFPSGDADVAEKEKGEIKKREVSKSKAENGEAKNKEKNVVSEKEEVKVVAEQCSDSAKVKSAKGFSEALKEIQILFERASESGNPVLELLDVGKLRYHRRIYLNTVSYKMMHVFAPSSPLGMESSLVGRRMGSGYEGVSRDKDLSYANLCSTLKKLCMWEKKLYHEVKAEEKLRILHQKKCKQLRRMKQKDSDPQKVDSVQTFIGILATKMKISIQVVDKISITIIAWNIIFPFHPSLTNDYYPCMWKRFLGMWKDMQECYKCQYKEIVEAKTLDASSLNGKHGNAHIDATIKLKSEVQKWNLSFLDWIHAQKSHVKALNGWLVRCLLYEPEEVPDDSTPFSPSKIGAPPVFVICHKWSRSVDNLSEKNVTEAVNGFMLRVNELLEKHILDLQQKLTLDKELERKVKMLEREEQKMHKVVRTRERKMGPVGREESDALLRGDDAVHHADIIDTTNLQSGLKHIFGAMERFSDTTARLYEELCQQIKQHDHVLGESNKNY